MTRRIPLVGALATTAVVMASACGMSSADEGAVPAPAAQTCPLPPGGSLGIAEGRRANSSGSSKAQVRRVIVDFLTAVPEGVEAPVAVVDVDGQPEVLPVDPFVGNAGTKEGLDFQKQQYFTVLENTLDGLRAHEKEADVLEAFSLAARAVLAHGQGAVVLDDSGLSTAGWLNHTEPGMLDATAGDIVNRLRANAVLPDLTGLSVFLAIGQTASPQAALSNYRQRLIDQWVGIAKAGGAACVSVLDAPEPVAVVQGVPAVTTVAIPGPLPLPKPGCDFVLPDAGPIAFKEGEAEFLDPNAAREQLSRIAKIVLEQNCPTLMVTGTTAHWHERDLEYHLDLSRRRAERVTTDLKDLHVPADRLLTRGVGYQFKEYVQDNDSRGLLPGLAQKNRTVRITPCAAECPPA